MGASARVDDPARITLRRRRALWMDIARAYKVVIDRRVVGRLRNGEEKTFLVEPGGHEVEIRIDWMGSPPLELDLAAGEEARLSCRGRNPLLVPYWITLGRKRYIALEQSAP
jgi:hypothetical protein